MTIAIVGAGLGGLTLARVLQVNGLDSVVYERRPSRSARTQGGMLDPHSGTGQQAMRNAGLFDQFHAIARPEGQDMKLLLRATRGRGTRFGHQHAQCLGRGRRHALRTVHGRRCDNRVPTRRPALRPARIRGDRPGESPMVVRHPDLSLNHRRCASVRTPIPSGTPTVSRRPPSPTYACRRRSTSGSRHGSMPQVRSPRAESAHR